MGVTAKRQLTDQLLDECVAMAQYAFTSGFKIPKSIIQLMDACQIYSCADKSEDTEHDEASSTALNPATDNEQINFENLASLHVALARIVAPATPRTIMLIRETYKKKGWHIGAVPLVQKFILVSLFFLLAWIAVSLSPWVDGNMDWSHGKGLNLLFEELFVLFAAGIGASFSILFQVNRFVVRGTYDTKYDSTYWARLVLGIVAGMILAFLIPLDQSGSLKEFTKPTFAMLGGFSVTVVHRILLRLVSAVESLVKGDTQDIIDTRVNTAKAEAEAANTEDKLKITSSLMVIRDKLETDADKKQLKNRINQLLETLLPDMQTETKTN